MFFKQFAPSPPLQNVIDHILLMHFYPREGYVAVKPYPTRIEQALVFFARGYIKARAVENDQVLPISRIALFGQQVSRLDFHPQCEDEFLMVMIVFRPGALFRVLGVQSCDITGHFCDAKCFLSDELRNLNDRIANESSFDRMIRHAENYILHKLVHVKRDASPIDRAAQLLMDYPQRFSLDWLADQVNLSPRQFQRKFIERIGIGPKLYGRISRFSQAFFFKDQHGEIDWLSVALKFGYTDYAHMVRDFRQFAYTTPNIIYNEYRQRPEIVLA